jgi:hypothetical protein
VASRDKRRPLIRSVRPHLRLSLIATFAILLFAPGALANHTAGGGLGGPLLPDLKTKEPERLSIS